MNIKSLIGKWSSVSAAAAVLLGSSNRAPASKVDSESDDAKLGNKDPYEPLILKPPAVKVIPEERFACHVSHSSHASHASHASHYSGSTGYAPYSTATASPSYSPPASTQPSGTSSIELANGTIIYGTLLTKSAGGITFTGADGKAYKVERSNLSPSTIAALQLPPEQPPAAVPSPAPMPNASPETTEIATLRKRNEELEQSVSKLNAENSMLREQLQTKSPSVAATAAAQLPTYHVVGLPQGSFLNIRQAPSAGSPTVVKLRLGQRGITLGSERLTNGTTVWQKVSVGGYTGWANADFLSPDSSSR